MNTYQAYSYLLVLIGIVYAVMFIYTLKPRENSLFSIFSLLCVFSSVYIFGTWFQLNADTIEQINFGQTIKYFGVPVSAAIWLVFAIRIHFRKKMSFAGMAFLFSVPVFTIMLVATNEFHGLFYESVSTFERDGFLLSTRMTGPLYFINIIYSYGVVLFVLYVFARAWIRSKFKIDSAYFWLLLGGVITVLLSVLYLLKLVPVGIDTIPLGYLLLAIAYAVALFRYNLFDSKQIFDKQIFSEIKEGLIITDENGLLIDYNRAAVDVFSWLTQANKGRPISDFDHGSELISSNDQGFCLRLAKGEQTRTYEFRITDLVENRRNVGRVYIFLDVTDQVKTLKELNYMVNHDSLTNVYNRRKILEELENKLQDTYSAQAAAVAEKLRSKISDTKHHIGANHIRITVSIGVAAVTASRPDIRELIKLADAALYEAKGTGRNKVIFAENETGEQAVTGADSEAVTGENSEVDTDAVTGADSE